MPSVSTEPSPLPPIDRASEGFHPGPDLHLPGPRAAVLTVDLEVGFGNRVGIESAVRPALGHPCIACLGDAAVDDEMRDADVLGLELARQALGEAAKPELGSKLHDAPWASPDYLTKDP